MADTRISALTAASALTGSEKIPLSDGTATTKAGTATQIKDFVTTAPVFAAGTGTAGTHPALTSGTLLSAAAAGAVEFVNPVLYFTGDTDGGRRQADTSHICYINSDVTGANSASAQPIFAAANDRMTVKAATTYLFELYLDVTNGTTTCTKALDFSGGTATFTAIRYWGIGMASAAINSTGTGQSTVHVDTTAATVIVATGTTAWFIAARGSFVVNASGTFLPQFKFSADPTGTVLIKRGTYIKLTPIGGANDIATGSWA
jgi:hypothetical protein